MNNPQSYHMSSYQGNQQGHDSYLRSDSNQPSGYMSGQATISQYRGQQKRFQPTGFVQSSVTLATFPIVA